MGSIHLITIEEVIHYSKDKEILWCNKDIKNILHTQGEEFILKALFNGGNTPNTFIPDEYFFGLDDRTTIAETDTFNFVIGEPAVFGYSRQSLSSVSGFTIVEAEEDVFRAQSVLLTFSAVGGTWGPVKNIFMTDMSDDTGFLISSVALNATSFEVTDGQSVTMRMTFGLQNSA